jgi:hypothetical protein
MDRTSANKATIPMILNSKIFSPINEWTELFFVFPLDVFETTERMIGEDKLQWIK